MGFYMSVSALSLWGLAPKAWASEAGHPFASGPDYWGFLLLFAAIFLSWTAVRLSRAAEE
jgi:hypothetical protein